MVSDAKRKEPLLAVSVINETPNRGVSTDLDGCYTLTNVKKGDIIQFSYLGYKQIEIRILEKVPPVLNVSMKEGKGNEYRELFYDPDDTSKYYDLKGKELPARPTAKGIYLRVKDGHPERLEIK